MPVASQEYNSCFHSFDPLRLTFDMGLSVLNFTWSSVILFFFFLIIVRNKYGHLITLHYINASSTLTQNQKRNKPPFVNK